MIETTTPRRRGRSALALLAGLLTVVVLSLGTDALLHATGVFPPWSQVMSDPLFGLATAYRALYAILGGWAVARLAPDRPMQHALWSGLVGTVLGIVGAAATWNADPPLGPKWYPLALVVTALPCSWFGAKIQAGLRR